MSANGHLTPLGDRVVVKPVQRDEVTKSGIVLPDTAKEKPQRGEIIAVGKGRLTDTGERLPMDALIRFVLSPEGEVVPDLKHELPGRGVWVKANAQAVAKAVADSVESGVIPKDQAENLVIVCGVFIHWDAADDKKIFQYNYEATKLSIARAMKGEPSAAEVTAKKGEAKHPFANV